MAGAWGGGVVFAVAVVSAIGVSSCPIIVAVAATSIATVVATVVVFVVVAASVAIVVATASIAIVVAVDHPRAKDVQARVLGEDMPGYVADVGARASTTAGRKERKQRAEARALLDVAIAMEKITYPPQHPATCPLQTARDIVVVSVLRRGSSRRGSWMGSGQQWALGGALDVESQFIISLV